MKPEDEIEIVERYIEWREAAALIGLPGDRDTYLTHLKLIEQAETIRSVHEIAWDSALDPKVRLSRISELTAPES